MVLNKPGMLFNFLKIALRHLAKNKSYVLISTGGMGIAIACCLTAYLLIAYNVEFDDFYKDRAAANVVKVVRTYENSEGERDDELESPMAIAPRILDDIAGIQDYTRFCNDNGIISHGPDAFYENIRFADASFFNMFNPPLKEGSATSFEEINTIILSQDLARKYFADKPATGNVLTVEINSKKYDVVVGGVLERIPLNTSFHIHALMRIERLLDAHNVQPNDWTSKLTATLLLKLSGMEELTAISRQMDQYVRLENDANAGLRSVSYRVVPFHEHIAKESVTETELRMPVPAVALITFCSLGGIILLIACFNLTNTTLAMTSSRLKEIAIRKVVGSARRHIATQLLLEIMIMISIAIVAAALMALVIVPRFTEMWELQYGLGDLNGINVLLALLALLFLVSVIAGIYPALYNSRLNAVTLFRGMKVRGTTIISRILLTGQFALSVIVLVGGITFMQNAQYQEQMDFGYDHANLLQLSTPEGSDFERMQIAALAQSSVISAAGAKNGVGPYSATYSAFRIDTTSFKCDMHRIAPGYIATVGFRIVEGREFLPGQGDLQSAIVDQNFARNHNLSNPLGKEIRYNDQPYRIVGVVSNHISGFKQRDNNEYVYLPVDPAGCSTLLIRTQPGQADDVRKSIERSWKKLFPGSPFQCRTQDEILYQDANVYNKNLGDIFFFLTVLGTMLAASGIYALASLNAVKRKKEVGIRKVLGASVSSIVRLMNREFAVILIIAVFSGGLLGYLLTNALLSSLYRQFSGVGTVSLILSAAIILILGLFTTSSTIVKAAVGNPTESLRSE